jgi:hypothetical protein
MPLNTSVRREQSDDGIDDTFVSLMSLACLIPKQTRRNWAEVLTRGGFRKLAYYLIQECDSEFWFRGSSFELT